VGIGATRDARVLSRNRPPPGLRVAQRA